MLSIEGLTLVQRDCHRNSRRHYLPQYDERLWHHHGRRCRVILDEPYEDDDDDDDDYDGRRCSIIGAPPLTFRYCEPSY
jgi:hypothetical protein